jgi:hypothetical protein
MATDAPRQSPFPGMDPYLQAHWPGVHTRLITYTADAIQPQLPGDLVARVEENVRLDVDDGLLALRNPDVYVVETSPPWATRSTPTAGAAGSDQATGPILLEVDHDPLVERHIEIREASGGRVVTAIEFLSPWNKAEGVGRDDYLRKRDQYAAARANLVEVDLIRGGRWYAMVLPHRVPAEHRSTYRVTVRRANAASKLELYPVWLWQRLPRIAVPLRPGEADVSVDLQELIDRVYRNGGFDRTDYAKPCDPPLEGEESRWAIETLRASGRT